MNDKTLISVFLGLSVFSTAILFGSENLLEKTADQKNQDAISRVASQNTTEKERQPTFAKSLLVISKDTPFRIEAKNDGWYSLHPVKIPVNPDRESDYGLEFEIRGLGEKDNEGKLTPMLYSLSGLGFVDYFDRDGNPRNDPKRMYFADDGHILDRLLDENWQTMRLEVMVKKGTGYISFTFNPGKSRGVYELRNMRLVEGGFPQNPFYSGPMYLDEIDSLKAGNPDKHVRYLIVKNEDKAWPETLENLSSRYIKIGPKNIEEYKSKVKSYSNLSAREIFHLFPERLAPSGFTGGKDMLWDPGEPDILKDQDGKEVDYQKYFPVTGWLEAISPRGIKTSYPYCDQYGAEAEAFLKRAVQNSSMYGRTFRDENDRVFTDIFMARTRTFRMMESALYLAGLYAATGERDYALKSGAILLAFARAMPGKALWGGSWDQYNQKKGIYYIGAFQPGDSYCWQASLFYYTTLVTLGPVLHCARVYDLLAGADIWNELAAISGVSNPRAVIINDLFLFPVKQTLRTLRFNVPNLWMYHHNETGSLMHACIGIGTAIDCPELVHYAVRNGENNLKYAFRTDGIYPESLAYHAQFQGEMARAFSLLEGYSDPPGFLSGRAGEKIENFSVNKDTPFMALANQAFDQFRFPDEKNVSFHDTDPFGKRKSPVDITVPALFPAFGHLWLGGGEFSKNTAIQAHLHFSSDSNTHNHRDPLNLILWSYGNELASDIGYVQYTKSSFRYSIFSHNTVAVDQTEPEVLPAIGNLLAWYAEPGIPQIAQAEQLSVYANTKVYRRALIFLPFADNANAVVDIFEVTGGSTHEWMLNGCANVTNQETETSLTFSGTRDSYAENNKIVSVLRDEKGPLGGTPGKKTEWYGVFRNARMAEPKTPWTATFLPRDKLPGLKLHWLCPLDATVALCRAPGLRLADKLCQAPSLKPDKSRDQADSLLMPKIIVKRQGENLSSIFVAVLEPYTNMTGIKNITLLSDGMGKKPLVIRVATGDEEAEVYYKKPEITEKVKYGNFESDAAFTVIKKSSDGTLILMNDGSEVKYENITVAVKRWNSLSVSGVEDNGRSILLDGEFAGYPSDPARQPHAGGEVIIAPTGGERKWLPLEKIIREAGRTRLVMKRDVGFVYDPRLRQFCETWKPRRIFFGTAAAELPMHCAIRITKNGADYRFKVKATGDVKLSIAGAGKPKDVSAVSQRSGRTWKPLVAIEGGGCVIQGCVIQLDAGEVAEETEVRCHF